MVFESKGLRKDDYYFLSPPVLSDYTAISNMRLEFLSAEDFHLVNVSITNDDIFENLLEMFTAVLVLDSPNLAAITISPSLATITISDDDSTSVLCYRIWLGFLVFFSISTTY